MAFYSNPYDLSNVGFGGLTSQDRFKIINNRIKTDPLFQVKKVVMNAGITKEAYFQNQGGKQGFWNLLQTDAKSNTPTSINNPANMWTSWTNARAFKGMISTWRQPGQQSTEDQVAAKQDPNNVLRNAIKYAFQFHYNPTTVDMAYGGVADIDIGMYTSGVEAFNALGGGVSQSTVAFDLVLNRIHDMKYFNDKGGLKEGVSNTAFAGRKPDSRELADIWKKGTMYDLEFLLRAIVGIQIESYLARGTSWDNKTADIGFLTGKPVELHLGTSLRYLGRIEKLSISHKIFNERMVPLFTQVSVVLTRIPDYAQNSYANLDFTAPPASPSSSTRGRTADAAERVIAGTQ